jgi:hypothetical protein
MNSLKRLWVLLRIALVPCVASIGCTSIDNTDSARNRKTETQQLDGDPPRPVEGHGKTSVSVEQSRVRVVRAGKTLCRLQPAMAVVERYELVNHAQQIIIKSRGKHGPATVELFNLSDGSRVDQVLAYAIRKDRPAWASGWQE